MVKDYLLLYLVRKGKEKNQFSDEIWIFCNV